MTRLPVQVAGLPTVGPDGREVRTFVTDYVDRGYVVPNVMWDHTDPALLTERLKRWLEDAEREASQ